MSTTDRGDPPLCPTCGKRMQWWPALDGTGHVAVCPTCPPASSPSPPGGTSKPADHTPALTQLDHLTRPASGRVFPILEQPEVSEPTDSPPPASQLGGLTQPASGPASSPSEPVAPSEPIETEASDRFKHLVAQAGEPPRDVSWPESLLEDLPAEARQLLASRKPQTPGPASTGKLREELVSVLRAQGYTIQEDMRGVRISGHPTGRLPGTDRLSASDVVRMAADLDGGIPPPTKVRRCPKCDAVIPVDSQRCQWCDHPLSPEAGA